MAVQRDFVRVGPPVHGRSKDSVLGCMDCNWDSPCMGVPEWGKQACIGCAPVRSTVVHVCATVSLTVAHVCATV
jgi:hypothetical protein